jgi:hypothetical protein
MKTTKVGKKLIRQISDEERERDRARLAAAAESARQALPGRVTPPTPPVPDPQPYESDEESYLAQVMHEVRG